MQDGNTLVPGEGLDPGSAQALLVLCTGLLPVWRRHLATSRTHSESAVSQMMQAFSDMGPHIDRAERQSQQINAALSPPSGAAAGLVATCESLLTPILRDAGLTPSSRIAIEQVLAMVRQAVTSLEGIARPMQKETHLVAEQVEQMYRGFQYQDRISQMMVLLEEDMDRLLSAMQNVQGNTPSLTQWLTELESRYAMNEQREDHVGQGSRDDPTGPVDSETTFF